jgi:hypothetical protein
MKRSILLFVLGTAALAAVMTAHHSISGVYDTSRHLTIEGVVAEFQFINPHPFLIIDVKDGADSRRWRLELDNRSELSRIGVTAQTLKPGDAVVVTGSPSRTLAESLYISRLDRPADGFRYEQIGSSPRIRTVR